MLDKVAKTSDMFKHHVPGPLGSVFLLFFYFLRLTLPLKGTPDFLPLVPNLEIHPKWEVRLCMPIAKCFPILISCKCFPRSLNMSIMSGHQRYIFCISKKLNKYLNFHKKN